MSAETLARTSRRIEELLDRFDTYPKTTGARGDAEELVRLVSALHAESLQTLLEAMYAAFGERARAIVEGCCGDPLVASVLVTHGLHPVTLEERVRRAIESVRPALQAKSGDAAATEIGEDLVRVRVDGPAQLVPIVERAIRSAAPEVLEVRAAGQTISLLEA